MALGPFKKNPVQREAIRNIHLLRTPQILYFRGLREAPLDLSRIEIYIYIHIHIYTYIFP